MISEKNNNHKTKQNETKKKTNVGKSLVVYGPVKLSREQ